MVRKYFLIYLIYGFVMINMGIFCLKEKGSNKSSLSLLKSLKYLGWFGILHGLSEWVTLLIIATLYPEYNEYLYNIAQILKALSFAVLMYFGFDLLSIKDTYNKSIKGIPIVLFVFYFLGYVILIKNNGLNYHMENPIFSIITMRYSLALTSGIASATALFLNSKIVEEQQSTKISNRYKQLAWVILFNGLLEGLLVQSNNFFPANIINRELFYDIFKVESLFLKALVGLLINYLLVKVVDTFSWEQEEYLKKLEVHKIVSEERRRLSMEIHDSIIQSLYALGLKFEYLLMNKDDKRMLERLNDIKDDLNNTIEKTRDLMTSTALDVVEIDELNNKIEQIIKKYNDNQNIKFNYTYELYPIMKGVLSPEKSTHIYYIVQEAISNVSKHSKATKAEVVLEAKYDLINISVIDNGIGLSKNDFYKDKHFGLETMKDRAEYIGGKFKVSNLIKGLKVSITEIPWEDEYE